MKEGAAINQSLSALGNATSALAEQPPHPTHLYPYDISKCVLVPWIGNVISALAEQSQNPKKKVFVPYRNSKLTQLLQASYFSNEFRIKF